MAVDMNCCQFVGRLTRDAEVRYSQSGLAVVRFSLAVNRRKQVGDQWQDEASFFDFVYMGKIAETLNQYLVKGRQLAVQSEAVMNSYEDRSGQKRSRVEFHVRSLQLLGSVQEGGSSQQAPAQRAQQAPSRAMQKATEPGIDYSVGPETFSDDEVPF